MLPQCCIFPKKSSVNEENGDKEQDSISDVDVCIPELIGPENEINAVVSSPTGDSTINKESNRL